MKQRMFFLAMIISFIFLASCEEKNNPTPIDTNPFLPFEEVKTSFSISESSFLYEENYSFCDKPNRVDQELSYGGAEGYFYVSGYSYSNYNNDVSEILVRFFAGGIESLNSSTIELSSILDLYENHPDRCFVNLTVEYLDKWYSCVHYNASPFEKNILDEKSIYRYQFMDEPLIMECFDNWPVVPIEFEYDGYLYTHDGQDSIKVSNFKSSFLVMKSI